MTELKQSEPPHLLVVDDSKVVRWTANKMLRKEYTVHLAEDGASAWSILQETPEIDLVLCDLQMPGMDGHEFLQLIRGDDDPRLINLPVIIITGEEDEDKVREQVRDEGATDFILKPFNELILRSRVAAYIGYQRHVVQWEQQTELDPISGLAGRNFFRTHVESNLALAERHQTEFTVAVLEIDQYQHLLQQLGNKVFLQLLFQVGKRIKTTIRKGDLAARIERAQFGLVLPLTNRIGGQRGVERICAAVDSMVLKYANKPLKISISSGVTWFNQHHTAGFDDLVAQAEHALRHAIAKGNRVISYHPQRTMAGQAHEQESPAAEAPDVDVQAMLDQLRLGKGRRLNDELLRGTLLQLWPLLECANGRLELGMEAALKSAYERLA